MLNDIAWCSFCGNSYEDCNCRDADETEGQDDPVADLLTALEEIAETVWEEAEPWDVGPRQRRILDAVDKAESVVMKDIDPHFPDPRPIYGEGKEEKDDDD